MIIILYKIYFLSNLNDTDNTVIKGTVNFFLLQLRYILLVCKQQI